MCEKCNVLVTGGNGFIGRAILETLSKDSNYDLIGVVRKASSAKFNRCSNFSIVDIGPRTDWKEALKNVDIVIHTAARVHKTIRNGEDNLELYRQVNTYGTLNLARQAQKLGVQRFIYISSVKVNGEVSEQDKPFKPYDMPAPHDPYAISKWEAEVGLLELAHSSDVEVVIIRPPLVYGPGVKGNIQKILNWIYKGIPLPLGSIENRRSMVGIDNLIDLIVKCMKHENAVNKVFMVSDDDDISTTSLVKKLGKALDVPVHLLPVPQKVLEIFLESIGKGDLADRICRSLQVDISLTKQELGWYPTANTDDIFRQMAWEYTRMFHD